jgi:hypothetical protein
MFKLKTFLFICITIILCRCFGLFDSSSDTLVGRYNVGWVDIISTRSINMADKDGDYGGAEIVPAYVYAVGHNKKFIIAKQHPVINERQEQVDTKKTNYFVIDLTKENYYKQEGLFGPLTENQFDSLCKKLNVGQIEFDMSYPDKP